MSDIVRQAEEAISQAEEKLRKMMEGALSRQCYADVARLAPMADALLSVIGSAAGETKGPNPTSGGVTNGEREDALPPRARTTTSSIPRTPEIGYPRFERQGDRLIKFAWSKKDRKEYEHRASADVVFRVAEIFEEQAETKNPFSMEALMPFKTRKHEDIPSYQAYLALAWFRSLGAVESRGKDGYAVVVPQLQKTAEDTWNHLPDTLRR